MERNRRESGVYPGVYRQQVGDRTRYGADIQGLPISGNGWGEVNTPLGTFRGGLSDDGVAGFDFAPVDNGMYPEVYRNGNSYGAAIQGMPFAGNGWGEMNTPIGRIRGGLSDDRVLGAEFTPNQYYIQALANLLRR